MPSYHSGFSQKWWSWRWSGSRSSGFHRRLWGRRLGWDESAIEDVSELRTNIQADSLFHPERAPEVQLLLRTALLAVIGVVSRRRSERARSRVGPRFGIQHVGV